MNDLNVINNCHNPGHISPYPVSLTKGSGIYVEDSNQKRYLDFTSGIAVLNFGHCHPRLVQALTDQAHKIAIVSRLFHNEPLTELLAKICQMTQMDQAIPMNSGAEANETAIKVIRKWAYQIKNIPLGHAEIITCQQSFHGRTITTSSMPNANAHTNPFGPMTTGFKPIPFNNIGALQRAITANTAAFIVEPIQGEAGVIAPDKHYLQACAKLCHDNNVKLIFDEIQTGIGRCGSVVAAEHAGITPDGITLGKALGGGLLPISMFLAKKELTQVLQPGDHGSTFGGNPLAAAVALEALNTLQDESLCQNAKTMGEYFMQQLQQLKLPTVTQVRGKGLLIGIQLESESEKMAKKLIAAGLLCVNTKNNTIRFLPPLIVTKDQIDEAIAIIHHVFNS